MVVLEQEQAEASETVNVYERAREAFDQSESLAAAAKQLAAWARDDRDLRDAITEGHLERLCYHLVSATMRESRGAAWASLFGTVKRVQAPTPDDASGLAGVAARTLMDYALSGGRRLGDMSKDGLLEEAHMYQKHATTLTIRRRWLVLIAEKVKPGKAVRECLSEAQLEALQRQALEE